MNNRWIRVAIAIVAAVALNAILYSVGAATGAEFIVPKEPEQTLGPLGIGGILGVTSGTMVAGALVFAALDRWATKWAWPVFGVLAGLLIVASYLPFLTEFATSTKLWLAPMHLIGPIALVVALRGASA